MEVGRQTERALAHLAHHDRDAGGVGDGVDLERVQDAAGLHDNDTLARIEELYPDRAMVRLHAYTKLVFEYLDTTAVLNTRGTARFIFVSTARPGAYGARSDGIGIVVGTHEALGEITGVCPSCQCDPSPVEPAVTWGVIKAVFK